MPNSDREQLGPGVERRLKDALDPITPPSSPPRYLLASRGGASAWRVAPVMLAVGAICLLALTATAATGSSNPAVWTQRAASTLQSIGHQPEVSPSPEPETTREPSGETPEPARGETAPTPSHEAEHESSPNPGPSQAPEHLSSPEPSESSTPSGDHSASSPRTSPSPSPTSGEHQESRRGRLPTRDNWSVT